MTDRYKSYAELRKQVGSRIEVSKLLGVCRKTIERRELGHSEVIPEMILALEKLNEKPK